MQRVFTGLDRLSEEGPSAAGLGPGARVGLLGHPASVDGQGRHAAMLLRRSTAWELMRLFAPEHGIWGREQDMEHVVGGIDPVTGVPVISLYGRKADSLRPRSEDLRDLDAVIVDLQDVGSRYYTFVYTLSFVMETAAESGLPVVVLDRPNPIGGERVEGPVLHDALSSFVGRYPLPVRHGMTVGELARLFNTEFGIGCDLRVVEMKGWSRSMAFEETRLPWVPPSPNMPATSTAHVYPGGCLIEGTNLSEGRGTTLPFELVGAPWLDGPALAAAMRGEGLPGVLFRAASFRPMYQKHAGVSCEGLQVVVADRGAFRPFETYLVLLREARRLAPHAFAWRTEAYEFEATRPAIDLLLGRSDLRPMLESGSSRAEMEALWRAELDGFMATRKPHLIYPLLASRR